MIKPGDFHCRRLADEIYFSLSRVGPPLDVIVVKPEDVERYGNTPCLVIAPALREGRVIYDATAI